MAAPAGVEQSGYVPNTGYTCYLGALSGSTYLCPSTAGGGVTLDTAVLTPSAASVATPGISSIDVSNPDAIQQGTAGGVVYKYAAQCVPGLADACVPGGTWSTPSVDSMTDVNATVSVDSLGTSIAPNTAYTYVHAHSCARSPRCSRFDALSGRFFPVGASLEPCRAGTMTAMPALLSPRRR
jgi:hypothetical protein